MHGVVTMRCIMTQIHVYVLRVKFAGACVWTTKCFASQVVVLIHKQDEEVCLIGCMHCRCSVLAVGELLALVSGA
jgi:hypothetical protein